MKPSIPKIQSWMRDLAVELALQGFRSKAKRLRRWATQLSRVKAIRKAPKKFPMPTPKQVLRVRHLVCTTKHSYKVISNMAGVGNDGRVSEIMRGKRGRPVYDRKGQRIKR